MKKIVVLERGWVIVGNVEQEGDCFVLTSGAVVRRWGTSKGLGELAEMGPLPETILDPLPTTKFHYNKIIMSINCSEEKWK